MNVYNVILTDIPMEILLIYLYIITEIAKKLLDYSDMAYLLKYLSDLKPFTIC